MSKHKNKYLNVTLDLVNAWVESLKRHGIDPASTGNGVDQVHCYLMTTDDVNVARRPSDRLQHLLDDYWNV